MTLLAKDTFIRANQTGFGTSSDGSIWSQAGTPTGQQSILSNEGLYSTVSGDGYSLLGSGTTGQINNLVEVRTATTNDYSGPVIRFDSTSINGYVAAVGDGLLYLMIVTAGAYTNLATVALSGWVQGDKWWVRLAGDGTTLRATAWKDGTSEPSAMLIATDSTYSSGKYGCFCIRQGTSATVSYIEVTDAPTVGSGPGVDPIIYGSAALDATLTTAGGMTTNINGAETSKTSTYSGGTGNFGEVTSQGLTANAVAAIPAAPTGQGWVYKPGAGTFAAGAWSASCTMANSVNAGSWQLRFFLLPGGVLASAVSIGLITANISATVKTIYTFAPTALPQTVFTPNDVLYIDLWYEDNSGLGGDTVTVYESTTATAGVPNDMQITTANFTPLAVASFVKPYVHYSIPRALGGTIIPLVIKPPVIYEPRALGSTLLTDARIFIPRALGGTYVQDDPTLLWVPHALGGTTQVTTSVALACTIQGIGLESTTLSLSTALTGTIPAVGLLAPTLTAKLALGSVTLPAIGVLTPSALTESTAFADTIPAVGTLSGTLLASLALSITIPAVGTLTGTFTESTALAVTIPAVGTLTGTLSTSANVNLSVTIPAVGTVTMAGADLSTALSDTIPAVGVLNPVLSASIGLTATSIPAVGTIVGTLGASAPLSSTVVGLGTLSATMAESTSLTISLSAVGTLNGTLTVGNSVSFTVTIPAVGTLTASAPGLKTTLTLSIAALGTIIPGATFSEALSGTTLVAIGILSGSTSLAVILGATLPGMGTISGAYQVRTALSLQLIALGALLGTIRVPATFFGPYSATERVSSKLASTHTVTSKTSSHTALSYTAVRK